MSHLDCRRAPRIAAQRCHGVATGGCRLGHEAMETTLTYLHAHLELKESALAKLKPYERAEAERPAFGIPERPMSMRTIPSANQWGPAELAGNAPFAANIRRDTRHSSMVGINCQAQRCRATDLSLRRPHQDRQRASRLSVVQAAELLTLSRSQVHRLLQAYDRDGRAGLVSKKRSQPSNRRHCEEFRNAALDLIR